MKFKIQSTFWASLAASSVLTMNGHLWAAPLGAMLCLVSASLWHVVTTLEAESEK